MKRMFYAAHTPSSLSRLVRSSVLFSSLLFSSLRRALSIPRAAAQPPLFPSSTSFSRQYAPYGPSAPASLLQHLPTTTYRLLPTAFPVILSEHRRTRPRIIINPRPRRTPCLCRSPLSTLSFSCTCLFLGRVPVCKRHRAIQGEPLSREPNVRRYPTINQVRISADFPPRVHRRNLCRTPRIFGAPFIVLDDAISTNRARKLRLLWQRAPINQYPPIPANLVTSELLIRIAALQASLLSTRSWMPLNRHLPTIREGNSLLGACLRHRVKPSSDTL